MMVEHLTDGSAPNSVASVAADADTLRLSVPQMILRAANEYGSRPALVDGLTKRTLSYRQLVSETRHAAKALAQRGLKKGDVVCLFSPNLPEYAVAVLAVTLAGGIVALAQPADDGAALLDLLQHTQAQWLLTTKRLHKTALLAASQSAVRHLYSFDSTQGIQHFAELFETVILENERPTEALLDVQRDGMLWWAGAPRPDSHALVTQALTAASASTGAQPRRVEIGGNSFVADQTSFMQLLLALWLGDTVVI